MAEEPKKENRKVVKPKPDGMVSVTFTTKSLRSGESDRIPKTMAMLLSRLGKVIINK